MSFLYFIVMVGALVFFHELGHFLVAKAFDVKVVRFSIGFGPRLIGFQYGETEYVICMLPLGGYVQMLGHDFADLEGVDKEELKRALMAKPIWQRSLVILAGPAFNIILPVLIYLIVGLTQTTASPSLVGEVFDETPAARGGLRPGDRVVAIDDQPVTYWHQLTDHVYDAYDKPLKFTYERDGARHETMITPEKKTSTDFLGLNVRTYGMIGIHQGTYGATIALAGADSPGQAQGLRSFDRVIAVNDEPIRRFDELEAKVRASGGQAMRLLLVRPRPVPHDFGMFYGVQTHAVEVKPVVQEGAYTLGITRAEMVVSRVQPDSPAQRAGLEPGDRLLSLNGKPYGSWALMVSQIHNAINEVLLKRPKDATSPVQVSFTLDYERRGQRLTTTLTPTVTELTGKAKQEGFKIEVGWSHIAHMLSPDPIDFPLGARTAYAAKTSLKETGGYMKMMVLGLVRMVQGRVGMDSLGGPILIGELAAQAGEAGIEPFLRMMALISINLAIFNLVPIPVLDGGQLTLFAIEAVKRGPISYRTRQIASYIGFALIVMLMLLAFKNDIERNWDRIVDVLQG